MKSDKAALSRREFGRILSAGTLSVLHALTPNLNAQSTLQAASVAARGAADELTFKSVTELARMVREKQISSEELIRAHLKRIEAVNKKLNAVCQIDTEGALRQAKAADAALAKGQSLGALHGVPYTVKDSFDTMGIVSAAGTVGRKSFVPMKDATVVTKLRGAGAIVLGKTNTPELTLGYETDNLVYGRTNNPYDLKRTPGGSSGGGAAIVAAGGAPFDMGSDTAGSLRIPSHFCGVTTLKPTFGRVSRYGNILGMGGVVGRRTHAGPIARYVEDLALVLPILCGPDGEDPDVVPVYNEDPKNVDFRMLKMAFYTNHEHANVSPEIDKVVRSAVRVLTEAGIEGDEKSPPGFSEADNILKTLNAGDGGDYYRKILREAGTTTFFPELNAWLETARNGVISGRKYSDVLVDWMRFRESALEFMKNYHLLICPVASDVAPEHGQSAGVNFSNCYYFNLLGWPAAVVRAGTSSKGLPIGVQIVGRLWADHQVLAAAQKIEQALGGYKRDFAEKALLEA